MRVLSLQSSRRRQVDRAPRSFYTLYCALTTSENHTRRLQTPPPPAAHNHPSSRFRVFLLSSSLALWLTGSLTQGGSRDGIESYLTGQSSDTQPLPTYGADSEVGRNSDQGIVTFGRNVLICSNLSYLNCFEKNRSFIAKVKLPSVSILNENGVILIFWLHVKKRPKRHVFSL